MRRKISRADKRRAAQGAATMGKAGVNLGDPKVSELRNLYLRKKISFTEFMYRIVELDEPKGGPDA